MESECPDTQNPGDSMKEKQMDPHDIVTELIKAIGDDPTREGLVDTPKRVVKSWRELFSGYGQTPSQFSTTFNEGYDQIIACKGIEFFSFCEHHMLPFYGSASIGYIPNDGKVIGLSKLARLVDMYGRRLQIQERLTKQISEGLQELINPKGVAVVLTGVHTCMTMRGVNKQNSNMVTSSMLGVFKDNHSARTEVMSIITS